MMLGKNLAVAAMFLAIGPLAVVAKEAADWPTWGHDQARTGWNRAETRLTKDNVSRLGVRWSVQLSIPLTDIVLSTMTAPVVVAGCEVAGS